MNKYKNLSGLTLIELIITITISSVILLTITGLKQFSHKSNRRIHLKSQMSNCATAVKLYILENNIKGNDTFFAYQLKKNCRWLVSKNLPTTNSVFLIKVICSPSTIKSDKLLNSKYISLHVKLLDENIVLLEYNLFLNLCD